MTPSWNDATRWAGLVDGSACPFCTEGPTGIVAELPTVYVTLNEGVAVPGYCCLIMRRHAVELHELDASEAAALMHDIQRVSRAVQTISGAIKINYEIHGNIIPHVHVHIIPRYAGDAIEVTGKGFASLTGFAYEPGELAEYTSELRAALGQE